MKFKLSKYRNTYFPLGLFLLFIIYVLFFINDQSTSLQMGFKSADRQTTYVFLILITVTLLFYCLLNTRGIVIRAPLNALILIAVWTSAVNIMNGVSRWSVLVHGNMAVQWILSYLFFETVRKNDAGKKTALQPFSVGLTVCFAAVLVYYFFDVMNRYGRFFVITAIYYLLAMLPWLCMNENANKRALFIVFGIFSMLSLKRGAIIALPLMLLTDVYIESRRKSDLSPFFKTMWIVVLLAAAVFIVNRGTGGALEARFARDTLISGSGRREQFEIVIPLLKKRSFIPLMLGVGCDNSISILGTGIHNEWLSFLDAYGFVGLALYAFMFGGFVSVSVKAYRKAPAIASQCFMMLVLYFVLSMISTGYGGYVGMWLFGFWGYANAEIDLAVANTEVLNNETM